MGGQDKRFENFVASSNYEIRKLNFKLKQGSKENSSLLFDVINNTVGVFFFIFYPNSSGNNSLQTSA